MTKSTKNAFDAELAMEEIFAAYEDYEQKINTDHDVLKALRNQYYLKVAARLRGLE